MRTAWTMALIGLAACDVGVDGFASPDPPAQAPPESWGEARVLSTPLQPCTASADRFDVRTLPVAPPGPPLALEGDHWGTDFGFGLAVADFDGDGHADIVIPGRGEPTRMLRQTAPLEFDGVPDAGLPTALCSGASAADLDADGDPDLWLMCDELDRVLRNDGGTFVDVTASLGIAVPERTLAVAWADVDDDGVIDPFACTFFGAWPDSAEDPAPDRLLRSGDGYDTPPEILPGAEQPSGCFAARWLDLDDDGALDLVTVHDKGNYFAPDRVWRQDGAFEERAAEIGLDQRHSGMGLAVADFDGDGALDLWKTSAPFDRLLMQRGATFVEAGAARGLHGPRPGTTWDVDAWDLDEDGDEDVYTGSAEYFTSAEPGREDVWFRNDGDRFTPVWALALGVPIGLTRSFARADLDGDGAPDLVFVHTDGIRVARGPCGDGGRLTVSVVRRGLPVVGATLRGELAGRPIVRVVTLGGQVQSSQPTDLHVGLAGEPALTQVSILEVGGRRSEVGELETGYHHVIALD